MTAVVLDLATAILLMRFGTFAILSLALLGTDGEVTNFITLHVDMEEGLLDGEEAFGIGLRRGDSGVQSRGHPLWSFQDGLEILILYHLEIQARLEPSSRWPLWC